LKCLACAGPVPHRSGCQKDRQHSDCECRGMAPLCCPRTCRPTQGGAASQGDSFRGPRADGVLENVSECPRKERPYEPSVRMSARLEESHQSETAEVHPKAHRCHPLRCRILEASRQLPQQTAESALRPREGFCKETITEDHEHQPVLRGTAKPLASDNHASTSAPPRSGASSDPECLCPGMQPVAARLRPG
jgi:hypothetical protein